MKFEIVQDSLLGDYCEAISDDFLKKHKQLQDSELSMGTFSFYTSVAAVFSSRIEGEAMELDSYVKHKRFGIEFSPDYTQKIDDLYIAYSFAQSNPCTQETIEAVHRIITTHILPAHTQGKVRTGTMYVTTSDGRIEYVAASPYAVEAEMNKFYSDLKTLIAADLTIQEVFYYAAMLHLVFVKIHPFNDGNGRTARLIEKWFLALKLGGKAWLIQSEKNYYQHHQTYYQNIRLLGLEYEALDYGKALPFLVMLPGALISEGYFMSGIVTPKSNDT